MILEIFGYVVLVGAIALHVAALQEPDLKLALRFALKKWAIYVVIGALILLWLAIGQSPDLLP